MDKQIVDSMQEILEGETSSLSQTLTVAKTAVDFARTAKDVYDLQKEAVALELESRGMSHEMEQTREKEAPEQSVEMEHDLER